MMCIAKAMVFQVNRQFFLLATAFYSHAPVQLLASARYSKNQKTYAHTYHRREPRLRDARLLWDKEEEEKRIQRKLHAYSTVSANEEKPNKNLYRCDA